jgi:hypothetical protein
MKDDARNHERDDARNHERDDARNREREDITLVRWMVPIPEVLSCITFLTVHA